MSELRRRITDALAKPILDDRRIDPMRELAEVLGVVGLDPFSGGGEIAFIGRDPIVKSPLPLATMAAVSLMAKAVSVADLWRFRGGTGQDLSVNLGQVPHRLQTVRQVPRHYPTRRVPGKQLVHLVGTHYFYSGRYSSILHEPR